MTVYLVRKSPSGPFQEIEIVESLPLSTVRYCDVGTTIALANQNGSEALPFASIQAAFDSLEAASGDYCSVLLAPGDYRAQTGLTFERAAALQISALEVVTRAWQSSTGPLIADVNYIGAVGLKLNGIQFGDIDAGPSSLGLEKLFV